MASHPPANPGRQGTGPRSGAGAPHPHYHMKYLPNIAGVLLGLPFVAFGVMFLMNMIPPQPPFPPGSTEALYMGSMGPSGYMHFVKVFELIGGLLVAIPKTRNFGLLVLGPILINIIAYHIFIAHGKDLFSPVLLILCALALYLLYVGRRSFAGLAN